MRENQSLVFPTRSNNNQVVQLQKKASSLKIWVNVEDALYCMCGENKGADQLCSYCTADLHLCFGIAKIRFSHDVAQMTNVFYVLLIQILFHIWGAWWPSSRESE